MTVYNFFDFNNAASQEPPEKQDPIVAFREALSRAGLGDPGEIIADGTLQRFGEKGSCWYVMHADGVPAGAAGDWRQGSSITWSLRTDLSPAEQKEQDRRIAEAQALREAERKKIAARAAEKAQTIWAASSTPGAHPYLHSKQVPAYGDIRQDKYGNLVVPLRDIHGKIHTLQFIDPSGSKKNLTGGAKQGHFFEIPGKGNRIYVAEGYATAATIHKATGATVIVALDTGNLAPVCDLWKDKGQIFVAADNDHKTPGNPGVTKAKETGHRVIIPEGMAGTDFNDLYTEKGIEEVRRQLGEGSAYRINVHDWSLDRYKGPAPERRWLIANTIPMGCVTVLAAKGDTGKGMLMLDMALKVGGTPGGFLEPAMALGNQIECHGTAVIFTAEDDLDEVHRRLERIGREGYEDVRVIPLPNAGGPAPIVVPGKNGPEATPFYYEVKEQLRQIPNLAMINFDPLASFVMADINADPAVGAFTMGLLASIGTETGAAVIVCHHLAKTSKSIRNHDDARALVRGSTAIVDGSRSVYVLWTMEDKQAKQTCNALDLRWTPNAVCQGCVVKSNGPADRQIKTFVRNSESGLLEVRDDVIRQVVGSQDEQLLEFLEQDVSRAAESGFPFVRSGAGEMALYPRRNELHFALQECGRQKIEKLAQILLEEGRIKKCRAKGSKLAKWLDVPGGIFWRGEGDFPEGARE